MMLEVFTKGVGEAWSTETREESLSSVGIVDVQDFLDKSTLVVSEQLVAVQLYGDGLLAGWAGVGGYLILTFGNLGDVVKGEAPVEGEQHGVPFQWCLPLKTAGTATDVRGGQP